jgi:hypothetical protein
MWRRVLKTAEAMAIMAILAPVWRRVLITTEAMTAKVMTSEALCAVRPAVAVLLAVAAVEPECRAVVVLRAPPPVVLRAVLPVAAASAAFIVVVAHNNPLAVPSAQLDPTHPRKNQTLRSALSSGSIL